MPMGTQGCAAMQNAGLFAAMMQKNRDREQGASSQKQGARSLQNARYSRRFEVPRQAQSECDLSTIHSNYDDSVSESSCSRSSERPQVVCQGNKTAKALHEAGMLIEQLSAQVKDQATELQCSEDFAQQCKAELSQSEKKVEDLIALKNEKIEEARELKRSAERMRGKSAERFEQEREKYNQARAEVSALRNYCKELEKENSRLKEQINTLLAKNTQLTEENKVLKQQREECDVLAEKLCLTIHDVKAEKNFVVRTAKTSAKGYLRDYTWGVVVGRGGDGDEPVE